MLVIESLGGCCPTQSEGTMDGYPFYFRARHGDWDLTVAKQGEDAIEAHIWRAKAKFIAEGDDPSHGCMHPDDVMAILHDHYRRWFGAHDPNWIPEKTDE